MATTQTLDATALRETAERLGSAVLAAWKKDLERDDTAYEPTAVYASGRRKCVRAMALDLIAWDQKPPRDPDALERMRRGKERESDVIARLTQVGKLSDPTFEVIHHEQFERILDRKGRVIIRMRIDGRLKFATGEAPPFEIKRYHPSTADRIETVDDFARSPWTRSAPDQMLAYLVGHSEPLGLFILETSGLPRIIPVILTEHLERAEGFLRDAEVAMDAKEAWPVLGQEALPPFIGDPSECRRCQHFGRACNPPLEFQAAQVLADPELEQTLARRHELAESAREFEQLDKMAKSRLRGIERGVCGDFLIEGTWSERKVSAREASVSKAFSLTIERISGGTP